MLLTFVNSLPTRKVAVIGAGYIAVELAGILNALGSQVSSLIRYDKVKELTLHKLLTIIIIVNSSINNKNVTQSFNDYRSAPLTTHSFRNVVYRFFINFLFNILGKINPY